ncbi:hypothetical protein HGRIS_005914 [Hohenbuehelia grisea]|uniref:NAD(P)-binding protein n=1 Tax=Hohenbuehelia grisea TaxID=104357 RepID=A0ABR3JY86_9AGAR
MEIRYRIRAYDQIHKTGMDFASPAAHLPLFRYAKAPRSLSREGLSGCSLRVSNITPSILRRLLAPVRRMAGWFDHSPHATLNGHAFVRPNPPELHSSSSDTSYRPFDPAAIFNVEGMVAVVTGGGTGIGLIIAMALESNGATVYIVGRRRHVLEKAASEHNRYNNLIPLVGDITDRDSLLEIVDIVKERHGYIDLLVNNAGVARNLLPHPLPVPEEAHAYPPSPPGSPGGPPPTPSIRAFQNALWSTGSPEDFADTFATNVTAPYYTTVAFLDLLHQGNLRKQHGSRSHLSGLGNGIGLRPPHHSSQVLTVSSSGSFRVDARVLSVSYTLSKCATTHLGKLLANLLSPWGIRSNILAPGVWPSEMTTVSSPGAKLSPDALASTVPLRRVGTEEDMAGTILFLASRAGAYVNGAVWLVDGGRVGSVASSY